jgi:HAD superfamily hydrolase (TIGR01549 family)
VKDRSRSLSDTAVSFDFDGVLARSPFGTGVLFPLLREMARARAARHGGDPGAEERRIRELVWAEFRRRLAAGETVEAYNWQSIVEVASRAIGEPFEASLAAMTAEYGRGIERTGDRSLLYPGAREVLEALAERGACLLLLTNGFRGYQLPLARALGLAEHFCAILASDDLGAVKPLPQAFELAFGRCPGRPARRFHVGDTVSHDVAGARASGVFAVWIDWDLPGSLARLGPLERARAAELEPVLRARYDGELRREGADAGALAGPCPQPDAVVRSLDEVEAVVDSAPALC